MKGICGDAKQQINHCMLLGNCENAENGLGNSKAISDSPVYCSERTYRSRKVQSLAINNTSSYDAMERPFRPDSLRGRWAKSADFYFASSTYAFNSMSFSDVNVWAILQRGWTFHLGTYILAVVFFSLPIFLIQTFLGQFSTSGAISAFRVSPIYKGVGYAIVLLNLCTLSYYSVNAAVPLIYAINSFHDVIPWMSCSNSWNSPNCSTHNSYNENATTLAPHSTVEYFHSMIGSMREGSTSFSISWSMVMAIVGIWIVVLILLLNSVSVIGKALRCACVLMFAFFLSVFVYMIIHEEVTFTTLSEYLNPQFYSWNIVFGAMGTSILQASMVLGPGWGSIITLGSYNRFRTDAENMSIWVSFTHIIISLMAIICAYVANDHFELHVAMWQVEKKHAMQSLYLSFSNLFASMTTLPKLWCFLFFSVLFLSEICAVIIQMMSVLTALFDEFEQLRHRKKSITIALTMSLALISIYFCTQMGFGQVSALTYISLFTQIVFSAILVLMSTWIYGRVRFQCDLQFMLGKTISSVKIFFIRFLVPAFIALSLYQTLFLLIVANNVGNALIWTSQILMYVLSMGYMFYKLSLTNGTWRQRTKQCFAPHDWHPVDADNRQFYEEIMGTSEMLVIDNGNVS